MGFNHRTGETNGMTCDMCHEFAEDGRFKGIPATAKCAECHSTALGSTETEKRLIEEFITPGKEIPWKVYSRQPDNAYFSHATHVTRGKLTCEECHGPHGSSSELPAYQVNRISGYSRTSGEETFQEYFQPWRDEMDRCSHADRIWLSCVACQIIRDQ
jgi:hypothetical protein